MFARIFIALCLLGRLAAAAETLVVQENVDSRILGTSAQKFEDLKKQHAAACTQWIKASPFHFFRTDLAPASQCSKAKYEKLTVTKKVHDCWTEIHPVTGQSIEYCGEVNKTEQIGYFGRSVGTRSFSVPANVDRREEDLSSDSFVGDTGRDLAWADFGVTCTQWLKDQATQFGAKLLFAGCRGAERDTVVLSKKDDIYRYDSKAVLLIER